MPVWPQQETFKCREPIYSDIPVAVVQDCFRRWGGIASYVLRYARSHDQQVLLKNVIAIADVNWLVDACGKLDADDAQVSHRLLHYRLSKQFISTSDGIGALAVLRGHLAAGGGSFRIRRLVDDVRHTEDDEYLSMEIGDEDEDEGGDHDMDADDDVAMEESVASTSDLH
ncbi:hypothetical protein GQ600_25551 [Phytophthora cactorum]|nr:hypothetical protein GQ600_25551 [Phytophthora cactorum]